MLCVLVVARSAAAAEPSELECLATESPPIGAQGIPTNPLFFGFGIAALTDPDGGLRATEPAPPPWDFDARYRVPTAPLAAGTSYSFELEVSGTTLPGVVTSGPGPDDTPPTAPVILRHFGASDPNQYSGCATNRVELLSLTPSTDDATPPGDLRYSVARQLPSGGLQRSYSELRLLDGGLLALPYGLQGLPGTYVVQARDWAGNLSPPSNSEAIDIGPGCDCAGRTTGPGPVSAFGLLGALFWWRQRRRVGRRTP
jgi:uncharacterized protein (TIGR03382 family)